MNAIKEPGPSLLQKRKESTAIEQNCSGTGIGSGEVPAQVNEVDTGGREQGLHVAGNIAATAPGKDEIMETVPERRSTDKKQNSEQVGTATPSVEMQRKIVAEKK